MMKVLKRNLSLLAVAAMLVSLLAACQTGASYDPVQEVMGYDKDTVFATFNGEKITAEDYLIWLTQNTERINQMQMMMGAEGIQWEEDMGNGLNAKEFLKQESLETVKLFWVIQKLASEEGVKLDAEDRKAFKEDKEAAIEATGGQEAYENYLKSMCLTDQSMEEISNVSTLASKMEQALCREGGKFDGTKETVRDYMEESGILKAKHILLLTKDPAVDGKAYSQQKIAEQKRLADDLLAQLRASEDPLTLFDQLMQEKSEDSGLEGNPNGYLFSTQPDNIDFTSRMVPEFEEGTKALGYNEISDVVKSEYGYHIILRLDPTEETETLEKYRAKWCGTQMDQLYQERMDEIEVETTEAYDNFDVQDFYEKLLAYRETMKTEAEEQGDAESSDKTDGQDDANADANDAEKEGADGDASGEGDSNENPDTNADGEPQPEDSENGAAGENGDENRQAAAE